jgi:hypothetical protein
MMVNLSYVKISNESIFNRICLAVTPIATYYITGANIYQSPTVYSVIANRLLTSLFHVNSAFQDAQSMMEYFPAKGYGWKSPSTASNLQKQNRSGKGASSQAYLKAQETQEFRVWMEKAIDTSAMRISQKEAASQTTDSGLATGGKVMDKQGSQLSSQTTQSGKFQAFQRANNPETSQITCCVFRFSGNQTPETQTRRYCF